MDHHIVLFLLVTSTYTTSSSSLFPQRSARDLTRVSFQECSVSTDDRVDCGYHGIQLDECQSRGCCWKPSDEPGASWCYHSNEHAVQECVAVRDVDRRDCGYYGINSRECSDGGCCWMPTNTPNAPWCFYSADEDSSSGAEGPGECGVPAVMPAVNTRIVGGDTATPHSWPWQISFTIRGRHSCGGSLINHLWVVSAAHCGPETNDPDQVEAILPLFGVALGVHNKDEREETLVEALVENVFTHPDYNQTTKDNDILLVKLAAPVAYSGTISPVCLPPPGDELPAGTVMQTTGWGNLEYSGDAPSELQQLTLPVWDNAECEERGVHLSNPITDNMICAGYMTAGRSSCHGDSGGPLVTLVDGRWTLFGVVSWGYQCGADDHAGLYAKVINYLDWIEETMRNN